MKLLSRASALAVLQADLVERALRERWPDLAVQRLTRSASGDRDARLSLWATPTKGVFTEDLSRALVSREADAVVHSWKDLPVDGRGDTTVAATLERADPRDVLLIRRDIVQTRPSTLRVLSSSPRRASQVAGAAARLLPWPVDHWDVQPVRGNVPTRLAALTGGDGDALVVAKAALDRLLSAAAPATVSAAVRRELDRCRWMVLPIRDFPTAAAQGALAVEVAADRPDIYARVRAINHEPTWLAVTRERRILQSLGGGCHDAVGITVLVRDFGEVTSVRAAIPGRPPTDVWTLDRSTGPLPPTTTADRIWPRPHERAFTRRRPLPVGSTPPSGGLWVTRADALPSHWRPADDQPVWAAGPRTWERLAARGVWVTGCADGLGDGERPSMDLLSGYHVQWCRLTHAQSGDPAALATYAADVELADDLVVRTHFFWTSGAAFLRALALYPSIRGGWHASGPGRTAGVIRDELGSPEQVSIWLDYDQWHQHVIA